jgi:purine-binding chemotaxis protein CheW
MNGEPAVSGAVEDLVQAGGASAIISTFYIDGALFGLDTAMVEEVVRPRRITRVAYSPDYVLGIMNLRGNIVTVLDLAQVLKLGKTSVTDDSRLYIVRDGDGIAGLMVDRAADVMELDAGALEAAGGVRGPESRFLKGITRSGDRLVTVLDVAAVLATENT